MEGSPCVLHGSGMGFGSMISPAKVLVEANFHEAYKDSKNTGNFAISTAATCLEAN